MVRVPETAKHAVSATLLINLKTVQHSAKNAINVVLRIISVHAVDLHGVTDKAQTDAEVEHQHVVGALRDITAPAEAGAPDPDHGSRSGSQTRNTHSIEIDRYDIDDIDVLRTFHSISRSKTVAAISNDTDPDGKMKILMKLRVKLPYRNIADVMEVKVDGGAEANILPLHTFRSMFPHKLDEDGYPKEDALRGSKITLQCYDDSKLVNHGTIRLRLKHYAKDSFQEHQFFIVETPTQKEIIIGHPASVRLGLIQVLCKNYAKTVSSIKTKQTKNLSRVHHIDGKTQPAKRSSSEPKSGRKSNNKSFQDPLSRPQSVTGQNMNERTKMSSFQDPKHRSEHTYGKNDRLQSKSSSFQDHHP